MAEHPATDELPPGAPAGQTSEALADTVQSLRVHREALARGAALGRYLVVDFLGEGGMARVYSAYDPDLDRKVAVKLLDVRDGDLEGARLNLLREAQAMARLSHPNVVPVYDAGAFGKELFVAMELVEGQTLQQWLTQRPRRRAEVLKAFVQAGEGLAAAHAAGLVHRDFKPQNVLVGTDGRVRVSDFGLARLAPRAGPGTDARSPLISTRGEVAGTPAYMAPEQFAGQEADPRTDQFSFCVSLWEALCGERPFPGQDFASLRSAVAAGALRAPARPLPRWLLRLLTQGLSTRREDRFPSLGELLALLRQDRKKRWLRAVEASLLAGALAAAVGAWLYRGHLEATRCERTAQGALARDWTGGARATVAERLRGIEGMDATSALAVLDRHFDRLAALRGEACRHADQHGASGTRLSACLEVQYARARAAVALLSTPGVEGAAIAALLDDLGDPDSCVRSAVATGQPDPVLLQHEVDTLVLDFQSRHTEAVQRCREGIALARKTQSRSQLASLELLLGRLLWASTGPTPESLDVLRQAVRDADETGDDEASFRGRVHLADLLSEGFERPEEAEPVTLDAQAWLRRMGESPDRVSRWALVRAHVLGRLGRTDEALAQYQRAFETAPAGSLRGALARGSRAAELTATSRYAEAMGEYEEAHQLALAARWRSPVALALNRGNLSETLLRQGRAQAALEAARAAEAYLAPLGDQAQNHRAWVQGDEAFALFELGRDAEATTAVDQVLAAPVEIDPAVRRQALAVRALLHLRAGRPTEALRAANEGLARGVPTHSDRFSVAWLRFAWAQAAWLQGERTPALAAALEARQVFQGAEDGLWRGRIEGWLASVAKR